MKTIVFSKKTIAELNNSELLNINGGNPFNTRPTTLDICERVNEILLSTQKPL